MCKRFFQVALFLSGELLFLPPRTQGRRCLARITRTSMTFGGNGIAGEARVLMGCPCHFCRDFVKT